MKKVLFIILNFIGFILLIEPYKSYASEEHFTTSDGVEFTFDDIVLYESDFDNVEFNSDQEVIDYIYSVGYNRVDLCYEYDISILNLTDAEKRLAIRYPQAAVQGHDDAIAAKEKTLEVYGYNTDGSIANAFQHAYWIMLMYFHTKDLNNSCENFAILEGYAHEEYDGNDEMSKYMDLYNDDRAYEKVTTISKATDDELVDIAKGLVNDGKLIYIRKDYRYTKEIIYHLSTGRVEYVYGYDDFYCYTNSSIPYDLPTPKVTKIKYEIMEGFVMEV